MNRLYCSLQYYCVNVHTVHRAQFLIHTIQLYRELSHTVLLLGSIFPFCWLVGRRKEHKNNICVKMVLGVYIIKNHYGNWMKLHESVESKQSHTQTQFTILQRGYKIIDFVGCSGLGYWLLVDVLSIVLQFFLFFLFFHFVFFIFCCCCCCRQ